MSEHPEHKVHVTALYTTTAAAAEFEAAQDETIAQVIATAYAKLEEERRPNDRYFCHDEPRLELAPYFGQTLEAMREQGLCVHERHGKLTFSLDIDAEPGGAA